MQGGVEAGARGGGAGPEPLTWVPAATSGLALAGGGGSGGYDDNEEEDIDYMFAELTAEDGTAEDETGNL